MNDYTQYVHEYETELGGTRYAVGEWHQEQGQYFRPFDRREWKLTGCSAEFCRTPNGMQSYSSRKKALARARYLFRPDPYDDHADLYEPVRKGPFDE